MLLPDGVRASRALSVSVRMPRGELRRKAFTLRHPHHRPSFYTCILTVYCMLYCLCLVLFLFFFVCYIVLLYLFTIPLVYVVLILDCVGYFHRPQKMLIQSRYTHISECFLLARLRRRINECNWRQLKFRSVSHCHVLYHSNARNISFIRTQPKQCSRKLFQWNVGLSTVNWSFSVDKRR